MVVVVACSILVTRQNAIAMVVEMAVVVKMADKSPPERGPRNSCNVSVDGNC